MSTVGDIMMHVGGYHEYRGGMIPLKLRNSSPILSTSHFLIAILVSAFDRDIIIDLVRCHVQAQAPCEIFKNSSTLAFLCHVANY